MTRRRPRDRAELDAHLAWLRYALRDRKVDTRLILEGLLDAIEAVAGMAGPRGGPPAGPDDDDFTGGAV